MLAVCSLVGTADILKASVAELMVVLLEKEVPEVSC